MNLEDAVYMLLLMLATNLHIYVVHLKIEDVRKKMGKKR